MLLELRHFTFKVTLLLKLPPPHLALNLATYDIRSWTANDVLVNVDVAPVDVHVIMPAPLIAPVPVHPTDPPPAAVQ